MTKKLINTERAPAAIGTYSQAIQYGNAAYISGQLAFNPATMELVEGDIEMQIHRVFMNLQAICEAAGASLNDILKLTIYMTELKHFPAVNAIMAEYFAEPFPARATIGVASLPRDAAIEMDAIVGL